MRRLILLVSVAGLTATSAQATGGLTCRTAGARPVEVTVGFGHAPGAPLFLVRLTENGRTIPATAPQWWLDQTELRLLLSDPTAMRREAIIKAVRRGPFYDGSLWRSGQRRWVRCRES